MNWISGLVLAVIVAGLGAAVGSMVQQARRGDDADPRIPWRWLLLTCGARLVLEALLGVAGLVSTFASAINSDWSARSIGAVVPFAVLGPLALAGATGRLHRDRQTDEP